MPTSSRISNLLIDGDKIQERCLKARASVDENIDFFHIKQKLKDVKTSNFGDDDDLDDEKNSAVKITRVDAFVAEWIKSCFSEAFSDILTRETSENEAEERRKTTDEAAYINCNKNSCCEDDLENKLERLRDWLQTTLKLKRVLGVGDSINDGDDECSSHHLRDKHILCDPFDHVDVEKIASVEGKTDKSGMPQGKCLVSLDTGDDLYGSWRRGAREGFGNSYGPTFESRGIRLIQGYYVGGLLQGPGHVKMINGCEFECNFVSGAVDGFVVSKFVRSLTDLDQDTCSRSHVVTGPFIAQFSCGRMVGHVWWSVLGGGWLHGHVDTRGTLSGDTCMYIYPDMRTVLLGAFHQSSMIRARSAAVEDVDFSREIPVLRCSTPQIQTLYKFQPSDTGTMLVSPLNSDQYEQSWVRVGESGVPGQEELLADR